MTNKNQEDSEPWNQILVDLWLLLTRGYLKFITIPIFVILFVLTIIGGPIDGFITLRDFYNENYNKKTSLNTGECDCIDEWVIIFSNYDSEEDAQDEFIKFQLELFKTGLLPEYSDAYVIRSPYGKQQWSIALDANSGVATKEKVEKAIRKLWEKVNNTRYNNIVERWLRNATAYYYSAKNFEKYHGKIINSVKCFNKNTPNN